MSRPIPGWAPCLPLVAIRAAHTSLAGGLVAAATALAPSQLASWTTAYLVLVGGVAQAALGSRAGTAHRPAAGPGGHHCRADRMERREWRRPGGRAPGRQLG